MLLLTHIFIATLSIILATVLVIRPKRVSLSINYGLIATTLTTGSLLVLSGAPMLSFCISGLAYTSLTIVLSIVAERRLVLTAMPRFAGN